MNPMFLADQQQAMSFLVSQVSHIEAEVYRTQYPDIQYQDLIPVDTSAPEWARSITFYSIDAVGRADWFHHNAKDVPLAELERHQFTRAIEMAAVGYRYTLEELGQSMMIPGVNLTADKALAARRAYEEFVEARAFLGDTQKGWTGLANAPGVQAANVAAGTGGLAWAGKTAAEIVRDINEALMASTLGTQGVEVANTVLIPIERWNALASATMPNSDQTALQFVQSNNSFTALTGQPITIRAIRGLLTAGAGGTARMIVYRNDPQVLKLHIPMPHRFMPVWQTGPLVFDVPGIFRFAGVDVRRPGAVRYRDGI